MKVAFLFLLFAAIATTASATRKTDLEFRLLSPQNNSSTTGAGTVNITLQVKNMGGEDLQHSDTIHLVLTVDGIITPIYDHLKGKLVPYINEGGYKLALGESALVFSQAFYVSDSGYHTFCFEASIWGSVSTPSITDTNAANNKSCSRVFFGTVGILSIDKQDLQFNIFPLPAGNTLSWKSNSQFQPTAFAFYSLIGACVQQENAGAGNASLDISRLPAGMYLLRATDKNGQVITRRFVKE